jgi:ethanolamine utilization protein EutQ (cupin superfamily)
VSATTPPVRCFSPGGESGPVRFGDRRIVITPAVEAAEGGPLSTYSAFFGAGERADLPAPYDEVWVVIRGRIVVGETGRMVSAAAGDHLHVPRDSPGQVEAIEDTELICISVPAH